MHKLMNQPILLLKFVIGLLYIALAAYIYLNQSIISFIQNSYRPVFCLVLALYGAFRLYRFYVELKEEA